MRRTLICLATTVLILVPGLYADICSSTTDCTFTFDEHNSGFSGITSTGPYGTVELQLVAGVVDVTLNMASNFRLIDTGFPGTFGFNDTLNDGTPTAGSFSSSLYSGSSNNGGVDTGGGSGSDLHFDGFGSFDDAAATSGPSAGNTSAVSDLSFTISRAGGFTSVQQLVEETTDGGDGSAFFVADVFDKACGANGGTACTGLVGVSQDAVVQPVPEPTSYAALLAGFGAIAFVIQRREFRRRNRIPRAE
jgi:PEP-CTERM motif-containing protein